MFTNFTFQTKPSNVYKLYISGESSCGDQLCEQLYKVFGDPASSKLFKLNIPSANNITNHRNVSKHINPGKTEQEIERRRHKSMFDLHYRNGGTLHRIITEATEPVNSGKEPLSRYLCHSINLADSKDNWLFNFKHPGFPEEHQRTFGVGEVELPGGAVYRQKEILMFFYIMQFTGMYPDGNLYNKRGQRVGTFNSVWNEEYFRNKHRGKEDHIWVQACNDSYYADQANIDVVLENWIRNKQERESSDDPSRASWQQAIDYVTQQLQRNRACEGSDETSSSEELEHSEHDRASGREQGKWQEEEEKVDSEEDRWKSKHEKEEVDGGDDRCRQEEHRRRRNKRDSRAQPEGNMDKPLCKCFKASENLQ